MINDDGDLQAATLIGVDWGSTNFRAWLLDSDHNIQGEKTAPIGLKSLNQPQEFDAAFQAQCADWLRETADAPVLFCGMVGARGGWQEVPYAPCPVQADNLIHQAHRFEIEGHPAYILPGASCYTDSGAADVMRGEELQILGAAQAMNLRDVRFCIPGTHCKWATLRGGTLIGFTTHVTGELYQLLFNQSLLGRLGTGEHFDETRFLEGVSRGATEALTHALFAARANTLLGKLDPEHIAAYLSGLLIGAEINAEAIDELELMLLASGEHTQRYALALAHLDRPHRVVDADNATRSGLALVAQALITSK